MARPRHIADISIVSMIYLPFRLAARMSRLFLSAALMAVIADELVRVADKSLRLCRPRFARHRQRPYPVNNCIRR